MWSIKFFFVFFLAIEVMPEEESYDFTLIFPTTNNTDEVNNDAGQSQRDRIESLILSIISKQNKNFTAAESLMNLFDVFESASTPEPDDYFTTTPEPCNCDPEGSESQECNSNGICDCKPWFTGDNCDTIKKGAYHTFTIINCMLIHTGA